MAALDAHPQLEDAGVGELMGRVATETSTLFKQQLALATEEIQTSARQAGREAVIIGVGASLGLASSILIGGGLSLLLGLILPLWLGAIIVGAALGAVASIALRHGVRGLGRVSMKPTRALQSLEENKSWLLTMVR